MDIVHDAIADFLSVDKTNALTQLSIYYGLLSIGGALFYLSFAGLSYFYFFVWNYDRTFPREGLTRDPALLRKQIKHEISIALRNNPIMALLMLPGPFFAHRGYSKLYSRVDEYGWGYLFASVLLFLVFTDCCIYFIHWGLHHKSVYKTLHKLHHTYRYTTPFSSHAFHSVDGFLQGCPYYLFVYLFPFHKVLHVIMFLSVNFWTISIHDEVDFGSKWLNGTGHHTIHHTEFNYNYGQYFTFWDRVMGTYKPAVQTHDLMTGKRI